MEGETYQLKPMNCPFHVEIYKNGYYSYRDLPLRWAELGTVYRYERSGAMQGLFRVRGFTQVLAPGLNDLQVEAEAGGCCLIWAALLYALLSLLSKLLLMLVSAGFLLHWRLSLRARFS